MTQDSSGSGAPTPRPLWMRLLGLRRREGGKLPFAPTRWGWALLVMLVAGIGMGAFAEYSMQPDFCRSCHLMEPYYQAWHESTHKGINCTLCHFEPGMEGMLWGKFQASSQAVKFITQTYGSKPHAEIKDTSCMRSGCHERRVLEGKVEWEVPTSRGGRITIKFDHTPHLQETRRGKQLRCVSCHSQIVQGQHLVVTLDTCYLCHMKDLEHGRHEETIGGCQSCHEPPQQDIRLATGMFNHLEYTSKGVECQNCHADVIRGDGAVMRQTCWNCHNREEQVRKYDDPPFLHKTHVTDHKVECSSCHVQIMHGIDVREAAHERAKQKGAHPLVATDTGSSCHEKMHGGPAEIYTGTGARGVPDMPSPMSRAQVDCIACHKQEKSSPGTAMVVGQTFTASEEACETCHGTKYKGTIAAWKQQVQTLLTHAEDRYSKAKLLVEAAKGLSTEDRATALQLLDDAAHNIRLVKLGQGVHNVNYATAALNVAVERSEQAIKLSEKSQ